MLPNEGDDPMNGDQAGADGTDVGLKELSGGAISQICKTMALEWDGNKQTDSQGIVC